MGNARSAFCVEHTPLTQKDTPTVDGRWYDLRQPSSEMKIVERVEKASCLPDPACVAGPTISRTTASLQQS